MISKYGYDVVGVVLLIVLVVLLSSWFLVESKFLRFLLTGLSLLLLVFTLYFFRDPERTPPQGDAFVLAPADGEIVQIKEAREEEFIKGDAVQVSIFMSPLNVHINRFPIGGTVGYFKHFPGEYLVAYDDKSSLRNERTHIGVENPMIRLLFKQIAGFVARRIVAAVKEGDRAVAGARFGMIRFGSRVDLLLPKGIELKVKIGDRTVAGETVLAEIP